MTVIEAIDKLAQRFVDAGLFFGHGTDNARDEAVWLVLAAIDAALDGSFDHWQQELTSQQRIVLDQWTKQRIEQRLPVAYIVGEAWFCGLQFKVNADVLIPRSPLAEMIVNGFRPWLNWPGPQRMLDLCTGSGCIAIAAALNLPWDEVHASDISEAALRIAKHNCKRYALEQRLKLFRSDLFRSLPSVEYDLIVANPPYVSELEYGQLPAEFLHEPRSGLTTPAQGLAIPLQILLQAGEFLTADGVLVMELGNSAQLLEQHTAGCVALTWASFSEDFGADSAGVLVLSKAELNAAETAFRQLQEQLTDVT